MTTTPVPPIAAADDASYLNAILQGSDDAIVSKDLKNGIILTFNAAAEDLYGYTAEEAVGRKIEELIIPARLVSEELDIRDQVAKDIPVRHTETFRRCADGSEVAVSISTMPVKNENGEVVAAAGFARDITDRHKAFETERRFEAIIENSNDAIVLKDVETGEILSWNQAATRVYGYSAEEALGQPIEMLIPEEKRAEEVDLRTRIAQGHDVSRYETVRRHQDGHAVAVELSISPVENAAGKIIAAAGFARDITETKVMERLAGIVVHSDDAIVVKDLPTGKIEFWNDAAEELYGYTAEEAIGQPIEMLIPDELRKGEADQREKIRADEKIPHHETKRRRKDGSLVDVSLAIAPLRDAAGNITSAARVARNITKTKELERETRNATGMLERFIDFTAHDFKTPMHHAHSSAELAVDALRNGQIDKAQRMLSRVETHTKWMSQRTNGLLQVVSLEGGRTGKSPTDANKAFDDSVEQLEAVHREARAATITRDELPTVDSDFNLLCFLFQNLVQNACKYGRRDVPVSVHADASPLDSGVQFTVTDNGMGIDPEHAEQIFEPFSRGANEGISGLGIGLHFCRLIVEWHGGTIKVEPGLGGVGSAFTFDIPA